MVFFEIDYNAVLNGVIIGIIVGLFLALVKSAVSFVIKWIRRRPSKKNLIIKNIKHTKSGAELFTDPDFFMI